MYLTAEPRLPGRLVQIPGKPTAGRPQHAAAAGESENYDSQNPAVRRPISGVRGRHGGVRGARFSGKHGGAPDGGGGGRNENV